MTTLKTIAEQAGVSVAAASAALSGREGTIGLAAETRERIRRIAAHAGYSPNPLATSLRTGRTGIIGICLREAEAYLAHPQGARNFWTMCDIAGRHGYRVSILIPDVGDLDARTMDGCLVLNDCMDATLTGQLVRLAAAVPVVSMTDSIPGAIPVHREHSLNVHRQRAAAYLYDLGHRHVAVAHLDQDAQREVPDQFHKAADERGLAVGVTPLAEHPLDRRYPSIDRLAGMDPLPTAVFAIDDDYARALVSRLFYEGIRVPEQVSVFSGSTSSAPPLIRPGLTGLLLHVERELEELFAAFVRIIEGKRQGECIQLSPFDVELIERESCAAPAGEGGS